MHLNRATRTPTHKGNSHLVLLGNSVVYAENFHRGVSFSVIWCSFICGVWCLWRHNLTSCLCF